MSRVLCLAVLLAASTARAQPAAYPLSRDALIPQTVVGVTNPSIRVLAHGGLVLVGTGMIAITDPELRVVQRIEHPAIWPTHRDAVDPSGRIVVTRSGVADVTTGVFRVAPEGRKYAGCELDVRRCATIEAKSNAIAHVRIEDPSTGTELDAFDITRRDVPGLAPPRHGESFRLVTRFGSLRANRLVFAIDDGTGFTTLVFDVVTHARVGSRMDPRTDELDIFLADDGASALFADRTSVRSIDTTVADLPVRGTVSGAFYPNASSAERVVIGNYPRLKIVDRRTFEIVPEALAADTLPVFGASGRAFVAASGVRFVDRDGRETSVRAEGSGLPYSSIVTSATLTPSGLYAWSTLHGLVRVRSTDAVARFSPVFPEALFSYFAPHPSGFMVTVRDQTFLVGRDGVATMPVGAALALRRQSAQTSSEAPELALRRALGTRDVDRIAVAGPERPGGAFAFLEGDRVHVTDVAGLDRVPPVRIPRAVERSGCEEVAFLTDVDVALFGPAPCVPTRVSMQSRRTRPLGRANVSIDSSRDGARVALMADRKVTILDGRTGATLLNFDPHLEHPREITIADDGQHATLSSDVAILLIDLRALTAGTPPPTQRRERARSMYSAEAERVFTCAEGKLRIEVPFATTPPVEVALAGCGASAERIEWFSAPGFVAAHFTHTTSFIVRLRDSAVLELEGIDAANVQALVVSRGPSILGIVTSDESLFLVRAEDGSLMSIPRGPDAAIAAIRAFFAPANSP